MASIKVLHIDDESEFLEVTKEFLEKGGEIQVESEDAAESVLPRLLRNRYDVIVSDYQMPNMNGLQLLKSLKRCGYTTPFIIFTGKGREEIAIEALNSGASFYLQKGGDPRVQFGLLRNAIMQLANRSEKEARPI